MKILGLDIGDRRIGIAVSDATGLIASGVTVLKRTDDSADADEIVRLAKENGCEKMVSGLPKNMDGTLGFQAKKVQEFVEKLKEKYDGEIIFWDERLTTVSAHRLMADNKVRKDKRKGQVDKIAACYILQGYLDSSLNKR